MDESCSTSSCCDKPNLLPTLIRLAIAVMFIMMGVSKFMGPDMFVGMLKMKMGLAGGMLTLAFWLTVIFEALGGLMVLLGKLVPRVLYKLSLLGQFVIMLMAFVTVSLPSGNLMGIWLNIIVGVALIGLFFGHPICCCGLTGSKKSCCCGMEG